MAEDETNLAETLRAYIESVRGLSSSDERRGPLMDLVRDFVGLQPSSYKVDRQVYGGREYSVLGNLVVTYTGNLHWQIKEVEPQLQRFIAYLKTRRPDVDYFAFVTDGLHFHSYLPQYSETGEEVRLERAHGLNLPSPLSTLEQATDDLRAILSPFRPD